MYNMPGTPLTAVSIGVATVCSTVWASAPIYWAETWTTGGVISGYWLTGRLAIEMIPRIIKISDMTMAVFGLFINVLAIMMRSV